MDEAKLSSRNMAIYVSKEALYLALSPVLWGTITQQFLLFRGVSAAFVGYYTSLVSAVQMAVTILLSTAGERVKDPLRFCTRSMLLLTVVSALFIPITLWDLGSGLTFLIVCLMCLAQLWLHSCKCVCDYKINYQIIQHHKYGSMVFLASAVSGFAGIAFSAMFSAMIDTNAGGNPYFLCFAVALALLALAVVLNSLLKPIYPVPTPNNPSPKLLQQLQVVLKDRSFRAFIIPNLMRGIMLSVTGCIVLIALVMDIDESGRAKIPLICAVATACSSGVYMLLCKRFSVSFICLVGGILSCGLIFLPRGNSTLFLAIYFVAYMGRILVDNTIPTMLYPIVDPRIAGAYHSWRSVLYGMSSLVVMPIVSSLVEIVDPLWLLVPASVTYLIVTVWYYLAYRKFSKT